MKRMIVATSIFSLSVLYGCNNAPTTEKEDLEKQTTIEESTEEVYLEKLNMYMAKNDIVKFSETVQEIKNNNLIEDNRFITIIDSFITQLIEEDDVELLKKYYPKIVNINAFVPNDKYRFRDFMRDKSEVADKEINKELDRMELALRENDFEKVAAYYNSTLLKNNEEASAMYHYSNYLQTDQNSYEDSLALALAVDYEYAGRLNKEIKAGVMNKSYESKSGVSFPKPIDDYFWRNVERSARIVEEVRETSQANQDEWERRKAEAIGKNPTLGMTTGQVEVSLWGKPEKINRTVNRNSTREQWVYGNGQYLYFTDGILTSFQD